MWRLLLVYGTACYSTLLLFSKCYCVLLLCPRFYSDPNLKVQTKKETIKSHDFTWEELYLAESHAILFFFVLERMLGMVIKVCLCILCFLVLQTGGSSDLLLESL